MVTGQTAATDYFFDTAQIELITIFFHSEIYFYLRVEWMEVVAVNRNDARPKTGPKCFSYEGLNEICARKGQHDNEWKSTRFERFTACVSGNGTHQ